MVTKMMASAVVSSTMIFLPSNARLQKKRQFSTQKISRFRVYLATVRLDVTVGWKLCEQNFSGESIFSEFFSGRNNFSECAQPDGGGGGGGGRSGGVGQASHHLELFQCARAFMMVQVAKLQ